MALTRELTKRYEEARHGRVSEIIATLETTPPKGEIVICIGPSPTGDKWSEADVLDALPQAIARAGVKRAAERLAKESGWAKRDVYQLALKVKNGSA